MPRCPNASASVLSAGDPVSLACADRNTSGPIVSVSVSCLLRDVSARDGHSDMDGLAVAVTPTDTLPHVPYSRHCGSFNGDQLVTVLGVVRNV